MLTNKVMVMFALTAQMMMIKIKTVFHQQEK
jgi:hypothetical protein